MKINLILKTMVALLPLAGCVSDSKKEEKSMSSGDAKKVREEVIVGQDTFVWSEPDTVRMTRSDPPYDTFDTVISVLIKPTPGR
jgi:hypothetical protein